MSENLKFHFEIDGSDFSSAGAASVMVKKKLRQLSYDPEIIRKVSIAMYEGEINMVIHANGGTADVEVSDEEITIILCDKGPGIPDIDLAMQAGYSTAKDNIRNLGFGAGMGFPNMKKYTDYINVDTNCLGGTTLKAGGTALTFFDIQRYRMFVISLHMYLDSSNRYFG